VANSTERQFQEADAAVERAVAAFMSKIEPLSAKWEAVARAYIVERVLLALCEGMTKLIDDPDVANNVGPATLKLSNDLADYCDAQPGRR
jgi:hypothetical protein